LQPAFLSRTNPPQNISHPTMTVLQPLNIALRSYDVDVGPDRHDFAQLVLPVSGTLAIDVDGKEGRLDSWHAAFVGGRTWHSQASERPNQSLIVDVDPAALGADIADRLMTLPLLPVTPAAHGLIDYMGQLMRSGAARAYTGGHWLPLLLDALMDAPPRPRVRLSGLLAAVEADPGQRWTTETMAAHVGVSVSRLYALFREELDSTPAGWLWGYRLDRVQQWLVGSDRAIAELAFRAGFADQSALTRAMRKATGMTPAVYRRHAQEAQPKDS
jgi:AraC-like DNA-binding protein